MGLAGSAARLKGSRTAHGRVAMGSGASLESASLCEVRELLRTLPNEQLAKVRAAVQACGSASASGSSATAEEIPAAWGWPKEPHDPEALRLHVLEQTKPTQQEAWDEALAARSIDGKKEDFVEEKAFANLLLNKEGTGDAKKDRGIDHHAYEKGKWYRFLNFKGDCYVYVHNYTRDITASRPDNFAELSEEEKALIKKLGVYIKELPAEIERVYNREKACLSRWRAYVCLLIVFCLRSSLSEFFPPGHQHQVVVWSKQNYQNIAQANESDNPKPTLNQHYNPNPPYFPRGKPTRNQVSCDP